MINYNCKLVIDNLLKIVNCKLKIKPMYLIQSLLTIFFIFAIFKVVGRYRAGDLSWRGLVFWLLFWIAAGVVVVMPDSTSYFARIVGIGRGADLVVYVALALLFFMVFRLMVRLEKINRDITKVVRKNALNDVNKPRNQ